MLQFEVYMKLKKSISCLNSIWKDFCSWKDFGITKQAVLDILMAGYYSGRCAHWAGPMHIKKSIPRGTRVLQKWSK